MSTAVLIPNADISVQLARSAGSFNYALVDEYPTPDDIATWVRNVTVQAWRTDRYGVPNQSLSGTINSVRLYYRGMRHSAYYGGGFRGVIRTHDTDYVTATRTPTSWTTYSELYTTNPNTGQPWTWTEIDALQIGCAAFSGYEYDPKNDQWYPADVTQVYAVVDYTPVTETAYDTMVGGPISWNWQKCDYGGAEQCPVGSETGWVWQAPASGGQNKTPQGGPTSFSWGSE